MKPFIKLAMSNEDLEVKIQEKLSEYKSNELSQVFIQKYLEQTPMLKEDFLDFQRRAVRLNRDAYPEIFMESRSNSFTPEKTAEITEFLSIFTETKSNDIRFEIAKENNITAQKLQQEFSKSISDRLSRHGKNNVAKLDYLIPRCAAFKAQILCLKRDLSKMNDLINWQNENLHTVSDYIKESETSTRQMESELIQVCTGGQIYQEKYDSLISDLTPLVVNPAALTQNNLKKILEKHGSTVEEIRSTVYKEMTQRSTIYQQTLNQTLSLKSIPPPPPPPPPSLENSIKFFTRNKMKNSNNNSPCIVIEDSPANYLSEILNGRFNLRPVEDLETWKKETKLKSAKCAIENFGTAIAAEMERRRIAIGDENENNGEDDELWY